MTFRCLWSSLSSSSSSSLYAYTLYRSRMHALDDDCGCSPLGGKSSLIKLKVYHRNLMGRDDFLGQVSVDFQEFKVHDRPKARYYTATIPGTIPVLYTVRTTPCIKLLKYKDARYTVCDFVPWSQYFSFPRFLLHSVLKA